MWNQYFIAYVLRRLGLIKLGYYSLFGLDFLRRLPSNWRYAWDHPDIPAPPALRRFETNYDTDLRRFVEGGRQDAMMFYELVKPLLPEGSLAVYEWGCGVGRLIRHMPDIDPPRVITAYGTDYKASLIDWCKRNIEGIRFQVNDLDPPLPFAADQFDLVYSASVFTHLPPKLQAVWIRENLRVVKPGGIFMLTLLGDAHKHRLVGTERDEYEQNGVVVRAGTGAGEPFFTTYNNPSFVEKGLLNGCKIVGQRLFPQGDMGPRQDIWIVRAG